jgi:hypothetical protein
MLLTVDCASRFRDDNDSPTARSLTQTLGRERPRWSALGPTLRVAGGVAHAPLLSLYLSPAAVRAAQSAARGRNQSCGNIP